MSARAATVLKRFGLSPQTATKAALRKAYFEQAKILHPDVAGADGETQFKSLQEMYNEALKYVEQAEMRKKYGEQPSGDGSGPAGGYGWQPHDQASAEWKAYQEFYKDKYSYHSNFGTSSQQRRKYKAPEPVELTPAQRIRNVIMGATGFLALFFFVDFFALRNQKPSEIPAGHTQPKPSPDAVKRRLLQRTDTQVDVPVQEGDELPVIDIRRTGSGLVEHNQVSDYYKKTLTKSVIRVPREEQKNLYTKEKPREEGLGATGKGIISFALGASPSEAPLRPATSSSAAASAAPAEAAEAAPAPATPVEAASAPAAAPVAEAVAASTEAASPASKEAPTEPAPLPLQETRSYGPQAPARRPSLSQQ